MIVRLPVPPSTNNLFVNKKVGGRFISPAYKAWRTEAGWVLNAARPELFGDKLVSVCISVPRKPSSRDIDNFCKPVLDLLTEHRVFADDKQVEWLLIARHDAPDISVTVEAFRRAIPSINFIETKA